MRVFGSSVIDALVGVLSSLGNQRKFNSLAMLLEENFRTLLSDLEAIPLRRDLVALFVKLLLSHNLVGI